MNIRNVCVLGGTGFIGSHLVARLNAAGFNVKVLTRRKVRHRDLTVLPRVKLVEANVYDLKALTREFQGVDAVINLVGILNEKGHDGRGFRRAHTELAQQVLEAAKGARVKRLLHMSALNASAANGSSHYLRSKGEAENHVHTFAGDIKVTSFRPSVVFGPEDSFVNRFAQLLKTTPPPFFPLTCPEAKFQPVYVGDVAEAFMQALEDPESFGQRIDLCGPRVYTLREIIEYIAKVMGLKRVVIPLPDWSSKLIATGSEYTVKFFSLDNYRSLQQDSICQGGETCPTAMESIVPYYLGKANRHAQYQDFRNRAGR